MNKDKLIDFRASFKEFKKKECGFITFGEIPLDEIAMTLFKKHDEVLLNLKSKDFKAVAFSILYNSDNRIIDICDAYVNNMKYFETLIVSNGFSSAVMANTTRVDQYYSTGGKLATKKTKDYINIKYLVISKRGINKKKLPVNKIYFYNHLEVLMTNRLTFDKFLDESIASRADSLVKWDGKVINPNVDVNNYAIQMTALQAAFQP